ncbi:MAG: SirB2 family protein, partial [Gammaproteobacteria bacterium]
MEIIKFIHVSCAALSISGFILRGIWMMNQSPYLQKTWVKISPHVIDTLLLLSAIILAINLSVNPLVQFWLLSKIIALIAYIVLGLIALRLGTTMLQRKLAWVTAILVFAYIVLVAIMKQSLPILL